MPRHPSVAITGTGFGGIAAAIELKQAGYQDLVLLEQADDLGGVWRENTYPGAACDVPSPFYSFSFAPNPRWPRRFAPQPAIRQYLRDLVDSYDLRRHLRFGARVVAATWDDTACEWQLDLADGDQVVADVWVPALGQLSAPILPAIAGRDSFTGPAFHSAEWRHDVDLTDRRVAVVGTGASAIQFVPELQLVAGHVDVYQRTPPYLMPRPDRGFGAAHHRLFAYLPVTQLAERFGWYAVLEGLSFSFLYAPLLQAALRQRSKLHMRRQTKAKPGLFEQVWPDYAFGCKRILFSSDYLPALAADNVELVTDPIVEITPQGVRTEGGGVREADAIVYGTGFAASEFLRGITVTGQQGRDLHEQWPTGAHAYFGMTVPGFPNMVMMYGPNTNTGGGSIIYFLETQAAYVRDLVDHLASFGEASAGGGALSVRADVERSHDEEVQAALADSVWTQCSSWYRNEHGRVTANWPWLMRHYRQLARFDANDYEWVPPQPATAPAEVTPAAAP